MGTLAIRVKVGVDLVHIPRLAALLADGTFLRRAFQPAELADGRPEHLAGLLAAKEACFKALGRPTSWPAVAVDTAHGPPRLQLSPEVAPPNLLSLEVSISHEGDYAVAVVVALLGEGSEDDERPGRDPE